MKTNNIKEKLLTNTHLFCCSKNRITAHLVIQIRKKMVYVITNNKIEDSNKTKVFVKVESKNLHNSLKFFIISLQVLGLLPVKNVTKSYNKIVFKWKCWKNLITLVMIILTSFAVCTCFYVWSDYGYVFSDLGSFVFYTGSGVTLVLYLRLSTKWASLMKSWCQMDRIMNKSYGYPSTLDRRLRICTAVCIIVAVIDHLLSIYTRYTQLVDKLGEQYDYTHFFIETFPQLYFVIPVNPVTAIYCVILNVHATLVQTFNDLLIVLLSITLALRFKQITQKLDEHFPKFHEKQQEFWIEIREDYDRLSLLCKKLDDTIDFIVLLSYSTNLFFLLIQLYQSLESVTGVIGKVYFVYSFVHLIFRIVCVSLYGAWINDESVAPATILNSVSSKCYNIEVRRLLMQISFDNVALTGCRMFKITRGIILSIAGAVVTYELVLIQFNSATDVHNF